MDLTIERLHPDAKLPTRASEGAAGYDLYACLPPGTGVKCRWAGSPYLQDYQAHARVVSLAPGDVVAIPLGFRTSFDDDFEAQIRTRSGLAIKQGLVVLNSPGTIDADYRGEWCVLVHNTGSAPVDITHGDRIAQAVFSAVEHPTIRESEVWDNTARGTGGMGSTGVAG